MHDDSTVNWSDRSEAAAQIVGNFAQAVARLIAECDEEGRYEQLIAEFRAGRTALLDGHASPDAHQPMK